MRTLLIDDLRTIPADVVARNYEDGIKALKTEKFDVLYLDHDLGDWSLKHRELTGYDVMVFLEEHPEHLPGKIVIVSSNPVGRARMQSVIDKLYGSAR